MYFEGPLWTVINKPKLFQGNCKDIGPTLTFVKCNFATNGVQEHQRMNPSANQTLYTVRKIRINY